MGEFTAEDRLLVINQKGLLKTIEPKLTTHFNEDMIVLEKWDPNKPISAVYFEGKKACYFVKRFMIENPNKEELFISDHPKSKLEIVATDYRPMAKIVFSKRSLEDSSLNFEEFIAVKGIKAQGNLLTKEKIKYIDLQEPLKYEPPVIDNLEVESEDIKPQEKPVEQEVTKTENPKAEKPVVRNLEVKPKEKPEGDGQTTLF